MRLLMYRNLKLFFGKMAPQALRKIHGYQYLDARAKSGAPILANKELALMSTICRQAERWGVIAANPFIDMMLNKADRNVRVVPRSLIVRFYLWSLRQDQAYRTMGCAAMFCFLTGFRAAEVRPFHRSGLSDDGVRVLSAKRKRGEDVVRKVRTWSPRLRCVVARAGQGKKTASLFLFSNQRGQIYSKSGWSSVWQDAMSVWIGSQDTTAAKAFEEKKRREAAKRRGEEAADHDGANAIASHPMYFTLSDVRPAAITQKLADRSADAYDFAAHANPSTTHRHYDRRSEKRAAATE